MTWVLGGTPYCEIIRKNLQKGISHNLHIALVNENGIIEGNNNYNFTLPENSYHKIIMPAVATSYSDLDKMLLERNSSALGAKC